MTTNKRSKDFEKAKEECNAISVDLLFDELEERIRRGYMSRLD